MSITCGVSRPFWFLILSAALVMPRVGHAAEKTYTNSIGMEFVLIPAGTVLVAQLAYEGTGGPELAYRFERFRASRQIE